MGVDFGWNFECVFADDRNLAEGGLDTEDFSVSAVSFGFKSLLLHVKIISAVKKCNKIAAE